MDKEHAKGTVDKVVDKAKEVADMLPAARSLRSKARLIRERGLLTMRQAT
jgi:hypothetical protein